MRTIWKFPAFAEAEALVGEHPRIVSVGKDPQGEVCVWVESTPRETLTPVHWAVVGTGQPFEALGKRYVGHVVDGPFVWHIFQVTA